MPDLIITIQKISIWAILIPLLVGLLRFRIADFQIRLFILFLVIGFVTDKTMDTLKDTSYSDYLPIIFNVYSLIEACTFLWLIYHNAGHNLIARISKISLYIIPLFWILLVLIDPEFIPATASQVFDLTYEVIVSFLAGFSLLKLVEKFDDAPKHPIFWILLGVFFYCFCTFYIMGFISTIVSEAIWPLNNIINIITYGFFSLGLLRLHLNT